MWLINNEERTLMLNAIKRKIAKNSYVRETKNKGKSFIKE